MIREVTAKTTTLRMKTTIRKSRKMPKDEIYILYKDTVTAIIVTKQTKNRSEYHDINMLNLSTNFRQRHIKYLVRN